MSRDHDYCVYILTNHTGTVLYIGVTSDLEGRLWEHAHGESGSKFTRKYHVNTLLYYEAFGDVHARHRPRKAAQGLDTRQERSAHPHDQPELCGFGRLAGIPRCLPTAGRSFGSVTLRSG